MFGFGRTNSPRMIDDLLCEMVGPDEAAAFWKQFKDNYITEEDIAFIASTGANTVRLPFHYKLFTDEDYMGLSAGQDGFDRIDACVQWCRKYGLYLILDMHDAPGGQTGDNIDIPGCSKANPPAGCSATSGSGSPGITGTNPSSWAMN